MSHLHGNIEDQTCNELMVETTIKCEIMSECDVKMEILDGSYETDQEVNGLMSIKEEKNEYVYCTEIETNEITYNKLSPCKYIVIKTESKSNDGEPCSTSISCSNDNLLRPKVSTPKKSRKRTKLCKKISPENTETQNKNRRKKRKVNNTDNVTYSCGFCFKTFHRCKDFFSHMTLHENEPKNLEQEKKEKIKTNESLIQSRKDKNNDNTKRKKEKKKKIKKESTEKTKLSDSKKIHQCDVCGMTFTFDNNLRRHKMIHAGLRYICDFCKKDYLRKSYLAHHINVIHLKIDDTVFKCTICKKSVKTAYALRWHMKTHSGLKPFKCDICMKGFSNKWNLKVHVKSWHK